MALRYRAPRPVRPLAHPSRMGLLRTRLRRFQAAAFLAALLIAGLGFFLMDEPSAPALTPSQTLATASLPLPVHHPTPTAPAPAVSAPSPAPAPAQPAAPEHRRQTPTPVAARDEAPAERATETEALNVAGTFFAEGTASYYGPGFAGRRTASGERFNPNALTAAHRTLPMGSRIRVTNPNNGKSVVVRVNDRGPFHGNRILDLSHEAARVIGIARRGTGRVLIEIIERASGRRSRRAEPVETQDPAPQSPPPVDTVTVPLVPDAPAPEPVPTDSTRR